MGPLRSDPQDEREQMNCNTPSRSGSSN